MGRRRRIERSAGRREARANVRENVRVCINFLDALLRIRAEDETGWMRFEGAARFDGYFNKIQNRDSTALVRFDSWDSAANAERAR